MTLNEFRALLTAKYPEATAARSSEVGGVNRQAGLTVTLTANGKMYSYAGTYQEIAYQLGLIEKWYVLENGGVVGQATSEAAATEKMIALKARAIQTANAWGNEVGEFTIRKVS